MEEQEEACCSNLHRMQDVALARPVDAHDVTIGGMVAAQVGKQEHKLTLLRIR